MKKDSTPTQPSAGASAPAGEERGCEGFDQFNTSGRRGKTASGEDDARELVIG